MKESWKTKARSSTNDVLEYATYIRAIEDFKEVLIKELENTEFKNVNSSAPVIEIINNLEWKS